MLYEEQYVHDALGRISRKTVTIDGQANVYVYAYSETGRLTDVTRDGIAIGHFEYDANGNRTVSNGASAAYDDQDRLTTFDGAQYRYSANGELQEIVAGADATAYVYDVFGNLTHADLPNGSQIDYLVDGRNRRIGKKVDGALMQGFLYQDQLKPAAELNAAGNVVSRFVYAGKANVPEYMVKGGVTYRLITDQLGSVRLAVDSTTGQIAQRIDYDEWGNVQADSNPGFQPFGFAGGLYDRDTQLVRFGARDYDAKTGRWTAKDPIGFNGGDTSLYSYVKSNPINLSDPSGLRPLTECEKNGLGPYIPKVDLDNANLHDGEVPFYLQEGYDGITRGDDIYFRPGVYDSTTAEGLALLGHELVHVGQYRNGMTAASYIWSTRNGYMKSPNEIDAYGLQKKIQEILKQNVDSGICGCQP